MWQSEVEIACAQVRNHVLTKWRGNVSAWLSEDEAAVKIMPKFRHFVTAAWKFLTLHGYINFGVAPAIMAKCLKTEPRKGRIIVVGAGLAGISLAMTCVASVYNASQVLENPAAVIEFILYSSQLMRLRYCHCRSWSCEAIKSSWA